MPASLLLKNRKIVIAFDKSFCQFMIHPVPKILVNKMKLLFREICLKIVIDPILHESAESGISPSGRIPETFGCSP